MFVNEKSMVDLIIKTLESGNNPWGPLQVATEFQYQRGRTDVIAVSEQGELLSFEAKLTKWKEALYQAYRNTSFSDYSYIVLPKKQAEIAVSHSDIFEKRGVGICSISIENTDIEVVFEAQQQEPLQPWLKNEAVMQASQEGERILNAIQGDSRSNLFIEEL